LRDVSFDIDRYFLLVIATKNTVYRVLHTITRALHPYLRILSRITLTIRNKAKESAMTRFSKLIVASVILGSTALSTLAVAEYGKGKEGCSHKGKHMGYHAMHGGHSGGERWLEKMTAKLELSDAQKAEVKNILDTAKVDSASLREKLRENMKAERSVMDSEVNEKELRKLAYKTADSRIDLMLFRQATERKVRAQLNEEQNTEFDTLKAKHKVHMQERMEKWQKRMDNKSAPADQKD